MLISLGVRTLLSKIPLLFNLLKFILKYKTNEIISIFLQAGDKYMPEMHLRAPWFTYSISGPFTKNKAFLDKAFDIAKDTKHDGYQRSLA